MGWTVEQQASQLTDSSGLQQALHFSMLVEKKKTVLTAAEKMSGSKSSRDLYFAFDEAARSLHHLPAGERTTLTTAAS